jgi:hypothetical protein
VAYITQYDVDRQQDAKNSALFSGLGDIANAFVENRQRALAQKRQQDAQGLEWAANGANPEQIEKAHKGDLKGIQQLYSDNATKKKELEAAKYAKDMESAGLQKRLTESTIAKNEADVRNAALPFMETKEGQAYVAKANFDAEMDKKKDLNKVNGKNIHEFNGRMQNILGEAEQLKSLINQKGTFETFGPHNATLAQKIDSIAIDAAKLFDPESVARDSEVAAFRKMLFEPGSLTTSNNTAIGTIDGFKKLVQDRATRSRGEEVTSDLTPDQKLERYKLLKSKKAGVAQGGY